MHHGNRPAQNQPNRIGVGGVTEIEAGATGTCSALRIRTRWHRPNCGGHWGLGSFGLCRLSVGCVGPIRPLARPLALGVSGGGSKRRTRTAGTAEATAVVTQSTPVVHQHGRGGPVSLSQPAPAKALLLLRAACSGSGATCQLAARRLRVALGVSSNFLLAGPAPRALYGKTRTPRPQTKQEGPGAAPKSGEGRSGRA